MEHYVQKEEVKGEIFLVSDNPPSTTKKKLKICPSCGGSFDIDSETCPSCGSPLIDLEPDMSLPTQYQPSSIEAPKIESSTFSVQKGPPIDLKELRQKINILWEERKAKQAAPSTLIFPEHVKEVTPREILTIISDIQKCYHYNIPNACPGLLRKALFSAIKIKFYMER